MLFSIHFNCKYFIFRLVDVISFDRKRAKTCAAAAAVTQKVSPLDISNVDESGSWYFNELWLACGSGFSQPPEQLHVVEVNTHGWQDHSTLKSDILQVSRDGETTNDNQPKTIESKCITSMCLVNENAIWIGDNAGHIHAYGVNEHSSETFSESFQAIDDQQFDQEGGYPLLFSYKMEPDAMEEPSPVRAIHFVPELQRVCVAMHNGRMFLCDAGVVPSGMIGGEGSFVMTELGSSSCIHSVTSVVKTQPKTLTATQSDQDDLSSVEIW